MGKLPWRCPEHPDAKILESWDEVRYVYSDGYPRGGGRENYQYECNVCGQKLRAPLGGSK